MANDDEIKKIQQRYKLEQQINKSIKENTKSINDYVDAQKQIVENYKDIQQLQKQIDDLMALGTKEAEEEAKILQAQKDNLIAINKELSKGKNLAKAVGNEFLGWGKQLASNFIPNLNSIFETFLKIDDLAHQTANTLGFQGAKLGLMKDNISISRDEFVGLGFEIEDAYKAQSALSEATGRQVMLTREASKSMAQTARITGMAVEGVAELSGQMEAFGLGAEESSKFILQMSKEASDMGLNSGKVIKSFQQNLGLLNKLNFKAGVKGLKEMAKFSEKYKIDMQDVAAVADKVFRPEAAIEAAAQLQVLGGDLAALGDPFQLMYKARNAPEELEKSLTKAAISTANFNDKTGEFEVSAMELDRLKEAASALGMDYSKLVETAKQGAKIKKFEGLLGGKGLDPETMEALTGAAQMGKEGAFVNIKGDKVFLKDMTAKQAEMFKRQEEDNAKLAEEAMSVQNDLTRIKNEIMVALVKLFERIEPFLKSLIEGLRWMAKKLIGFLEGMNNIFGAKGTLGILLAAYFGAKALYWYAMGKKFGQGFNSVASAEGGKGGILSKLNPFSKKFKEGGPGWTPTGKPGEFREDATGNIAQNNPSNMTKGMNMTDMIKGAAAILILSAALYVFAKALQEFDKLENGWETLAMAASGLLLLTGALFIVSKIPTGGVIKGAFAIAVLGAGMIPLGIGMSYMQDVDWMVLAVATGAIIGFAFAAEALGAVVATPMFWLGLLGLAAASAVLAGSLWILSFGLEAVSPSMKTFMDSISMLPTLIGPLLLFGPALMLTAAGIGVLALSLIALGAAWWFGGSAFTEMSEAIGTSLKGIDPSGLKASIDAINSVDTEKLEALKELSLFMSMLGTTTTIKFDESLTIDGSIELSGQSGGKSNTDWIKDPIFVSKLKELIADATESDKRGGKK